MSDIGKGKPVDVLAPLRWFAALIAAAHGHRPNACSDRLDRDERQPRTQEQAGKH